ETDMTARRRVLHGVLQEVTDSLRKANGIAHDAQWLVRNLHSESLATCRSRQGGGGEWIGQAIDEVDFALAQAQCPLTDSGSVHQIFGETGDAFDLPVNRVNHPEHVGLLGGCPAKHL